MGPSGLTWSTFNASMKAKRLEVAMECTAGDCELWCLVVTVKISGRLVYI
jgi:hypothetical protein